MSQKHSKSQDEISQLLDSFEVEDTLEEKMENFTQEKERQSRIERARKNSQDFNRRNTEEMDLTQIIDPIDDSEFEDEEYEEDGSQTKTMMWDKDQIDPEPQIPIRPLSSMMMRSSLCWRKIKVLD